LAAVFDENGVNITGFRPEYWHTDHLGNVRLAFSDVNNNGRIEIEDDPGTPEDDTEVMQENHYYPFGMNQMGPWYEVVAPENKYQYNGKELNEELGLDWYDYGARWYDGSIGRWGQVDRLAEKYFVFSPYHFVANNPIKNFDVDGNEFTENAWDWVMRLTRAIDRYQSYNNKKIDKHREKMSSGNLSTKQTNKRKRQIEKLQQKNQDLESLRGEIAELAVSNQIYDVVQSNKFNDPNYDKAGTLFNSKTGSVDIVLPSSANIGLFAHELHHAFQFEVGTTSLSSHDGSLNPIGIADWLAYDQQDEIDAYRVQGLFGSTQSRLPNEYSNRPVGPVSVDSAPAIINLKRFGRSGEISHQHLQALAKSTRMAFRWSRIINGVSTRTTYGPN
jgi:RHS repeat-associated protein